MYEQNCSFWQHAGKNVATKLHCTAAANVGWEKAESHLCHSHYTGCIVTGEAQREEGHAHPAGLGEKLTGLSCGIGITEHRPNHKQENVF